MSSIQTFSIVVGTKACNAKCPFCVSRMTGFDVLPPKGEVDVINFRKACLLAQIGSTTTVLLTGKGEPTLYPAEVTEYLQLLREWDFPLIEMQTNALEIGRLARDGNSRIPGLTVETLQRWRELGLNTIAISAVSTRSAANARVYHEDYPGLDGTADLLHRLGFTVRLCIMMMSGAVDEPAAALGVVDFCREHGIEQLTVRPLRKPESPHDAGAAAHVAEHGLSRPQEQAISEWLARNGTPIMSLMHGAEVYDLEGQNICLSDCLTTNTKSGDIRTLIFYSNGRLAYDWQYDGAVILGGRRTDGR